MRWTTANVTAAFLDGNPLALSGTQGDLPLYHDFILRAVTAFGDEIRTVHVEVIAPTATNTPIPTNTPRPTDTPLIRIPPLIATPTYNNNAQIVDVSSDMTLRPGQSYFDFALCFATLALRLGAIQVTILAPQTIGKISSRHSCAVRLHLVRPVSYH